MFRVGAFAARKSLATMISVKQKVRTFSRGSTLSTYLALCQSSYRIPGDKEVAA
jgi:hypothetical protein